jgi:hypothetical protein
MLPRRFNTSGILAAINLLATTIIGFVSISSLNSRSSPK